MLFYEISNLSFYLPTICMLPFFVYKATPSYTETGKYPYSPYNLFIVSAISYNAYPSHSPYNYFYYY